MQKISNHTLIMQLTHFSLLSTSILLLLLLSLAAVESTISSNPKTLHDFIKSSCQVTLYSNLCYSTLSSSYNGDLDIGKLTYVAIGISLIEANWTADYVTAIKNKISAKDVVVRDCVELTKGAVGLIRDSLDEMKMVLKSSGARRRNERGRRNIRFEMSNVQTWMSAAITNQDTCMEGFNDVQVGKKVDDEVSEKVGYVVKLISNALSLVNSFAADA
ncbi:pectinesterase inhibitor 9-like [Chenopodium quinoa]|uniref:pectinesterase inhibitor 9-like n=1 Tax=Chenopodium quinoa TaxID=63459 RepID=UPI000B796D92|nr:pectinesterase inhibitor 9-like [Chenopodium quinoa]